MTTFNYNSNIPNGPNDPADDCPLMNENFTSITSILDVDHVGFNATNGGIHKQVTMFTEATPSVPTPGSSGALFASLVNSNAYPYWTNSDGTFPLMTGALQQAANGFASIPGGILIQWGTKAVLAAGSFTTVSFSAANVNFPNNCFNVILTMINNQGSSPSANGLFVRSGSVSTTGFQIINTSGSSSQSAYWIAIGN